MSVLHDKVYQLANKDKRFKRDFFKQSDTFERWYLLSLFKFTFPLDINIMHGCAKLSLQLPCHF